MYLVYPCLSTCQKKSTCAWLHCSNNQTKTKRQECFFGLPATPEIKRAWINAINSKEGTVPHNVACSNRFGEVCFNHSWRLQSKLCYTDCPVKKKVDKDATSKILYHENSIVQHATSLEYEKNLKMRGLFLLFFVVS